KLNYRHYRGSEKGRRVIAIGGLTLSRGLTLEGLCVSYFYRNSKAYDTLLQMGRWFGYRPGYHDLFRVWMAPDAQDWFGHIAEVVNELRGDIRHMHVNRLPPSRFGIRVKSHPDLLLVTAQNKMQHSDEVEVEASFARRGIETASLPKDPDANERNVDITADFLRSLGRSSLLGSRYIWRKVPASQVAGYLNELEIHPVNQAFMPDARTREHPLLTFIAETDVPQLREWDICVAQGKGEAAAGVTVSGPNGEELAVAKRQRQFEKSLSRDVHYLKVNKQRVGDIRDVMVDLTKDDIRVAEDNWHSSDPKTRAEKRVPGEA